MSLSEQLGKDYIAAYKAKDSVCLGVLRLLKTALKNYQVEHRVIPDDEVILDVIAKQCKQRQDSIEQYQQVNRFELAQKEAEELAVLRSYMPTPLTEEELRLAISDIITEISASGLRDMGKVMQALTQLYKGRFDGKFASDVVKKTLSA